MSITNEILKEFKGRMHLGDHEDENLRSILSASVTALQEDCGGYDLTNLRFKELAFERSRYVYNDALEYFSNNFLTEINNLKLKKALDEISLEGDLSETV